MLASVRNRRGVVSAVEPFDGPSGRLHLVHLEYTDGRPPTAERLVWQLEPEVGRQLLEPNALPDPYSGPMRTEDFDALVRAARWTALSPYVDLDGNGALDREPVASPFHGGVRVEDYQLVPLLKALRMPRVSLLIADDVGLGKTVEAGLILAELLLRRRIRRVLVLTPASLRQQWRDEMWQKFALRFNLVDRHETDRLRRKLGMDASPWRSFDRIVASYHYLRQPDVREQFLATCRTPQGSPHLPWDLLIVDECHNLMPAPFGQDSELCTTLRLVAPRFEHRLFLSATPHNGHTRSFTGLLEMLDPVRFTRTSEMGQRMRQRVETVVIRRLKSDINAIGSPRFCTRLPPKGVSIDFGPEEAALSKAFDAFRTAVHELAAEGTKSRRRAGSFAVEVLGKRLLSCPAAFADSWFRTRQGFDLERASDKEVVTTERTVRQDTGDDREAEQREATAATVVGAWLKGFANDVKVEIRDLDQALSELGFQPDARPPTTQIPSADARFDALTSLIRCLMIDGDGFRDDERLIVFTEYKTTLDYLARRLRGKTSPGSVLTLFGAGGPEGMNEADRERVKEAFNDPNSPVRILIATDAASEGLNLQQTARYLLHYDCPWNPSRLEQRNGRLDRYGQCRDVTVHHFVSDSDPDLRFLDHVVRKAAAIREDLGTLNDVFDQAIHRRLIRGEDAETVERELDLGVDAAKKGAAIHADSAVRPSDGKDGAALANLLDTLAAEIDLDERTLADTLETAMATSASRPQLREANEYGCYRLVRPDLPGWKEVIDANVRLPGPKDTLGRMPTLAFSTEPFIEQQGSLSVFSPPRDTVFLHLAHPLMQRALGHLARFRYPGEGQVSRWTARVGSVPSGAEAVVLFTVEELAVNELRETFHRWVRTVAFPVRDGNLGKPLAHLPARTLGAAIEAEDTNQRDQAQEIFEDIRSGLRRWLLDHRHRLASSLQARLRQDKAQAVQREDERYRQRQGELSRLIEGSTLERLEKEIADLKTREQQLALFDESNQLGDIARSIDAKQKEVKQRSAHYGEIRDQLVRERERILEHLLPARYAMAGTSQVFPVSVEIRLPDPEIQTSVSSGRLLEARANAN